MATIDDILSAIDSGQKAALDRLFAFLSIPSISAVPAHFPDCERAADWLVKELGDLGFEAAKRPTAGRPMVVGHIKAARREAPHVLFYGHYDVQPVDPLNLWRNPPFEPRLEAGPNGEEIVARGACDDKGQLMTFLEACRAFKRFGGPPCHITTLFEGEEETGSLSLPAFLAENAKELKADVALVCDTGMWDRATPAITVALRGIVGEEVILTGANRDLHSGLYGGLAVNPIHVLSKILGELHDDTGAVAIPGFYDGVEEVPQEISDQWHELNFDSAGFLREVGLTTPAGERDRSPLEILWSRPTCEVNGIFGGYTGEGTKTVLPAKASAKITCRLVSKQNPERISESFRAFVTSRLPPDVKAEFVSHQGSAAISVPIKNQALRIARRALETEWEKPAALVGSGGSIPVVGLFKRELSMDSLLVGFALDDDRVHSPNEKYDRASFHKGARSWARILAAIGA
jgi:acetylornithine deacetylase/succinyl-diaminopimelate desuccinylase-like protein